MLSQFGQPLWFLSQFLSTFFVWCYIDSFQLPVLEGRPNVTVLDLQIKNLRDAAVKSIKQMAVRIKEEATDIKATISDIEDWLDRLKQLAEEVRTMKTVKLAVCMLCHQMTFVVNSLRTACQM